MKKLLVLKASEDIKKAEIDNIVNQIELYGIKSDVFEITSLEDLKKALRNGEKYDYVYLATHGCDTKFWKYFGKPICYK